MSYSLVRASLDLVEYETDVNTDKKKKKKKHQNGVLDLIPAHQRVLQKGKTPRSHKNNSQNLRKLLKNSGNSVQDNVQTLLLLSNRRLDEETAEKLFNRAVKQPFKPKEKPQEEQSVFTEGDFARFAAEYMDE